MNKVYIASGWFNEEQSRDLERIKSLLKELSISYFSPKDECLVSSNEKITNQEKVFQDNIEAIQKAPFIVANTRGKDMGTIFECGVAYSNHIPIIYYCEGLKGHFNLMLSRSGRAVATNINELKEYIANIILDPSYNSSYKGKVE